MLKSLFAFLSVGVKADLFQNFKVLKPSGKKKKSSRLEIRLQRKAVLLSEVFPCSSHSSGQHPKPESGSRKFGSRSVVL